MHDCGLGCKISLSGYATNSDPADLLPPLDVRIPGLAALT